MNDELDPNLLAMFDAAKEESLDDNFVDELMIRVDRDRRRGLIVWAAVAAVVALIAYFVAGPVSATLQMVGNLLPTSLINIETAWVRDLLSPINSVAAALAIGVLLVRRFWRGIFG